MRAAVVAGDGALRRGLARPSLLQMLEEVSAWADVGRARKVVDFLDGRAESPLESLSRVIFDEYNVPLPEPQYEIEVAGRSFRVDFYWKQQRLIGEADGRVKYTGELDETRSPQDVLWEEKLREDALRDDDYRIVRWTYDQILRETDATIARIQRRLSR